MIRIVADSTCDLSKELIKKYDITIIPLNILLGEEEFLDGENITPMQIFKWADENKTTPKTSAVSIEKAVSVLRPFVDAGDEIISFSIASGMSTSGNVMRLAVEALDAERKVKIVDSANLSTGIGLLVIEAAVMAKQGMAVDDIVARIEELKPFVRASFVVDTLMYLYRGGRCSGLAAMAGGALKLHPRIAVENGKMSPGKKYRGSIGKVIMSYVKDMEEELCHAKKDRVFITHSGCSREVVEEVRNYLEALGYFDEILETVAGGVISSHCGPGTLGVLFISEG